METITHLLDSGWALVLLAVASIIAVLPSMKAMTILEDKLVTKGLLRHTSGWWRRKYGVPFGLGSRHVTIYLPKHLLSPEGLRLRALQNRFFLGYAIFLVVFILYAVLISKGRWQV